MRRCAIFICLFLFLLGASFALSETSPPTIVNYEKIKVLMGYAGEILSVAFSPDGKIMAIGTTEKKVFIWDVSTWQIIATLEGNIDRVMAVAFSPDGKILASGDRGNRIYLWNTTTWKTIDRIKVKEGIETLTFNHDGSLLAVAYDDKTAVLWDMKNKTIYKKLEGHKDDTNAIAFSPDGTMVATGSKDHTIIIWDVVSGKPMKTLYGHSSNVLVVAYSSDGKYLASGGADNMVIIWDAKAGTLLNTLMGHSNTVCSLSFIPNTTIVQSGECKIFLGIFFVKAHVAGSGCNIIFWDIETAKPLKSVDNDCSLSCSAFSPEAKYFAVGNATHEGQFVIVYEHK